jgi:hypothetical protein
MIAKMQGASNINNCNITTTTSTMQQSFVHVVLQGATTIKKLRQGKNKMTPTQH